MKKAQSVIIVTMMIFAGMRFNSYGQNSDQQQSTESKKETYSCPMHKDIMAQNPGTCSKCGMNLRKRNSAGQTKIADRMGTPFFEKSVDGLKIMVWFQTQEEHKQMMNENRGNMRRHRSGRGRGDTSVMNQMQNGTHHIMVTIIEEKTGKEVGDKVELQLNSPSKKQASVSLLKRERHFGSGVLLDEKGIYRVTVNAALGRRTNKVDFTYDVK